MMERVRLEIKVNFLNLSNGLVFEIQINGKNL